MGDLPGAMSSDLRASLGITHIISVCPNYPSTGPNHLEISVLDSEYENLLIHLPNACRFIQDALDSGGRVLVHCVMGVSRSCTVTAAYLMWTKHWTTVQALEFIQARRRCVHPNYGFIRQLQTYQACNYEPSPENVVYTAWKRKAKRDVAGYLRMWSDTIRFSPMNLHVNSDFPTDKEQGELFLVDMEVSHLLTISPSQITSLALKSISHRHLDVTSSSKEALLLALPEACAYIRESLAAGQSHVLVHCRTEMRACIVIAAYLMSSQKITSGEASLTLEKVLPLFERTPNFTRHLELFEACAYNPTPESPALRHWLAYPGTPSDTAAMQNAAARILAGSDSPRFSGRESPHPIGRTFDLSAFNKALEDIQATRLIEASW
ncbi:phosphatases II [Athelia psychrophila]|uniref:protein-tyrosine-phosphatase n=1 Tax=Athelia psychrophila TaxID=1759441 RepID=A0A165YWB5_9AGAM|nr:phosphatases II [Fibularhizoctonia sp. CBS 109695]